MDLLDLLDSAWGQCQYVIWRRQNTSARHLRDANTRQHVILCRHYTSASHTTPAGHVSTSYMAASVPEKTILLMTGLSIEILLTKCAISEYTECPPMWSEQTECPPMWSEQTECPSMWSEQTECPPMWSVAALFSRILLNLCQQNVTHGIPAVFIINLGHHNVSTSWCRLHVSTLSIHRQHAVNTSLARCQPIVSTMSTLRQHAVNTSSARCLHIVSTLSTHRQHAVNTSSARCQHIVSTLSTHHQHAFNTSSARC